MLELDKLYNACCFDGMAQIESGTVDMILSDLPYGMTECKWDVELPLDRLWEQYKRICKPNAAVILTAKQPFTTDLIMSNRDWYRYSLVWLKNSSTGFLNAKVMPLQSHEDICVFYKNKPTYNPQMESGFQRKTSRASAKRKCKAAEIYNKAINISDYDSEERYPISVLYFGSDKHKCAIHPTQKPVALFEYLINTFSNPGNVVFDGCMGSGTTAIAAIEAGRRWIGFEIDTDIYRAAQERIDRHTAQMSMFWRPTSK